MAWYILDIALIAIMLFLIILSAKKGFIRSSKSILALILTAVLLTSMHGAVFGFLQSSKIGDAIHKTVGKNITKTYEKEQLPENTNTTDTATALMICASLGLPKFMQNSISATISEMSEIKNNVMEVITDSIVSIILRVLAMILLFLLVRVFVFIILKILESLFTLPGLKTLNRTLGMLIGIVNALLAVYIICGAITLFAPMDSLTDIKTAIDSTYILKYFYNNNLLLSLFV